MQLQIGQKSKLSDLDILNNFTINFSLTNSFEIDISCFGLDENNQLKDDRYLVFYNVTESPNKEIKYTQHGNNHSFSIDYNALPSSINKLVFTASIGDSNTMQNLNKLEAKLGNSDFTFSGNQFKQEKAIMICELYKKDNIWRFGVVGQGFNGGLDALLTHFGGTVAEAPTQSTPTIPVSQPVASNIDLRKKVFLEKRISLEKTLQSKAPQLLDLSKKAAVSLEKKGLGEHMARVALCLDISGSMSPLYKSGIIQQFVERVLALSCRFDDDGAIDVFLFGAKGYHVAPLTFSDFRNYVPNMLRKYDLEGDTYYSKPIELVRKHYTTYSQERTSPLKLDLPVYVMFLTDGQPSDRRETTRALRNASYEPIFWQFMGVGTASFSYLEELDDLEDRFVDNADFFSIKDLSKVSDDDLFDKMVNEYPSWINNVKQKGLID